MPGASPSASILRRFPAWPMPALASVLPIGGGLRSECGGVRARRGKWSALAGWRAAVAMGDAPLDGGGMAVNLVSGGRCSIDWRLAVFNWLAIGGVQFGWWLAIG